MANAQIARVAGVSRPTVIGWRDRYEQGGIKGMEDEPRSGRPAEISEADVVWPRWLMMGALQSGWVLRTGRPGSWLRNWGSHSPAWQGSGGSGRSSRTGSRRSKFSTDPELEPKIRDVVGLYLAPPENAVVVSVDEKSAGAGPGPDGPDAAAAAGPGGAAHP